IKRNCTNQYWKTETHSGSNNYRQILWLGHPYILRVIRSRGCMLDQVVHNVIREQIAKLSFLKKEFTVLVVSSRNAIRPTKRQIGSNHFQVYGFMSGIPAFRFPKVAKGQWILCNCLVGN